LGVKASEEWGLSGLPHRKMKLTKTIAVEASFIFYFSNSSCAGASANPVQLLDIRECIQSSSIPYFIFYGVNKIYTRETN